MKITQNKIGASARQNEETNCVKHQWNQYLRCLKSEIICSKVKKKNQDVRLRMQAESLKVYF